MTTLIKLLFQHRQWNPWPNFINHGPNLVKKRGNQQSNNEHKINETLWGRRWIRWRRRWWCRGRGLRARHCCDLHLHALIAMTHCTTCKVTCGRLVQFHKHHCHCSLSSQHCQYYNSCTHSHCLVQPHYAKKSTWKLPQEKRINT